MEKKCQSSKSQQLVVVLSGFSDVRLLEYVLLTWQVFVIYAIIIVYLTNKVMVKDGRTPGVVGGFDGDFDLTDDPSKDRPWESVTLPEGAIIQVTVLKEDGSILQLSNCRDVFDLASALSEFNPGTRVGFEVRSENNKRVDGEVILAGDIGVNIAHILRVGFGIEVEGYDSRNILVPTVDSLGGDVTEVRGGLRGLDLSEE